MVSISTLLFLMAVFFITCGGLSWAFSNKLIKTKETYLLADRKFEVVRGAFSVSAAWTWATALFVVPQLSYQFGFTGFFWVLCINVITLGLFGFAASKIRQLYPNGFTFAEHIKNLYGKAAHNTYLFAFMIVAVLSLALNIYAGSTMLEKLTGLNMNISALFIIASAVLFGILRGMPSTNITEIFKMCIVMGSAVVLVPLVWNEVSWEVVRKGMTGKTGTYGDLWGTAEATTVFLTTGIYFVFRHISLPWSDNGFWQRAFAINPLKIKRTYALASVMFAVAPILFGTLGFVAAGSGFAVSNPQLTNVEVIGHFLSPWALGVVVFVLLTAIISLLDSQLNSISTLLSHDIYPQIKSTLSESRLIDLSRLSVLGLLLLSWALINVPGVNIVYFGFISSCVCITFFIPSVLALFKPTWMTAKGLVVGVLSGLIIGFPIYAYANLNKMMEWSLVGFFTCLILSATFSLGSGLIQNRKSI
jgi:Na+/proline symporter